MTESWITSVDKTSQIVPAPAAREQSRDLLADAPRIYRVHPTRHVTASLFNSTSLECEAEANPAPSYRWLQSRAHQPGTLRGAEGRLRLTNVTYEHRGHYVCLATNVINGQERTDRSDPVHLKVVGE